MAGRTIWRNAIWHLPLFLGYLPPLKDENIKSVSAGGSQTSKQLLPTIPQLSFLLVQFWESHIWNLPSFWDRFLNLIFLSFGGFRNCDVTVKGEYEHARDQIFNRLTSCFQLFGFPLKTFENFNNLFQPWWICTSSFGFYILYIWGQRSVTLTTKNHSFSHFSHWPDFCETSCPCNGF